MFCAFNMFERQKNLNDPAS